MKNWFHYRFKFSHGLSYVPVSGVGKNYQWNVQEKNHYAMLAKLKFEDDVKDLEGNITSPHLLNHRYGAINIMFLPISNLQTFIPGGNGGARAGWSILAESKNINSLCSYR